MRSKLLSAFLWICLAARLFQGTALGENRPVNHAAGNLAFSAAVHGACGAKQERSWWSVLYEDAMLLAQADNAPEEGEGTAAEKEVVFVWPLWEWLLSLLGLSG